MKKYLDKKENILDAGCGDQKHPYVFSELLKDYKITGVDLDNWHPKIIKGDITNLKFNDNSFDTVICLDVLEHIKNWSAVLNKLVKISKNRVIISVPATESKIFLLVNQFLRKIVGVNNFIFAGHYRDFTPQQLFQFAQEKKIKCQMHKIKFASPVLANFLFRNNFRYGGIFIFDKGE